MNGASSKMDFQDYKKLTEEERELFIFGQLCKLDAFENLETRFAAKWVESAMKGSISVIVLGFIATLFSLIGWHMPNQ